MQRTGFPHPGGKAIKENCGACEREYDLTATNSKVFLYLADNQYDHIQAGCPYCQHQTILFCPPSVLLDFLRDTKPSININLEALDDLKQFHRRTVARETQQESDLNRLAARFKLLE